MTTLTDVENRAGLARITCGWKKADLPLEWVRRYWRDVHSPAITRRAGIFRAAAEPVLAEARADEILAAVAGFGRAFYEREECEAQLASMREAFSRTDPEAFVRGTKMLEEVDLSPWARRVRAPTLLIAGEEDNMTPFTPADSGIGFSRIQHMIPDCELVTVPDSGHYLVIEQPEATAALVRKFLQAGPAVTSAGRP